jgi:hypothetical protein
MNFREELLNCLKPLKSGASFAKVGSIPFVFPGLQVDGVGELSYPIPETQVKSLLKVAHKAPFGKGYETLVDDTVRSAKELEANALHFIGPQWDNLLQQIIKEIQPSMGLENYEIEARLYKMLIYEQGDFFLTHKDTEKEKGMFGSLVVVLPSHHVGGELHIRFNGEAEVADFANAADFYSIHYAAFYADCDHEIKPLKSGNRICLVYNLVQNSKTEKIKPTSVREHADKVSEVLLQSALQTQTEPYIILLGHQYTPENFSQESLKLDDGLKADVILKAAQQVGFYANLCLVTSFVTGMPEYSGYYGDDVDDDAEIHEIFDEWMNIEHWLPGDNPPIKRLSFEEEDLIALFQLDEHEPIVKESTGYMGNYGPDINHWYYYGAVVVWSKQTNALLLDQEDQQSLLAWMNYFNQEEIQCSVEEARTINHRFLAQLSASQTLPKTSFDPLVDWFIGQNDKTIFLNESAESIQNILGSINEDNWCKLLDFWSPEEALAIVEKASSPIKLQVAKPLMATLRKLVERGAHLSFVQSQMNQLPRYFDMLYQDLSEGQIPVSETMLTDLFWLEKTLSPDSTWKAVLQSIISGYHDRKYIHFLLVPTLLECKARNEFSSTLLSSCIEYLQSRAAAEPQKPTNWSRAVPKSQDYKEQWSMLRSFLESPTQDVFDFRKNQHERTQLENAINSVRIDLRSETIKVGSPHTLRIFKTMDAYHRELDQWHTDKRLLAHVLAQTSGH